ncbi:helix-turn-helix transcriptional regulator [bacterium]|nr:helix-turn-helix transcriptional regulator [bacterium]
MVTATPEAGKVPVSATLGNRIRAARRDAGMSQGQLATALNTTQSAISLYEAGQRSVGIDMLLNVARILNRPLHYFLGEDGDMLYVKDSDIASLIAELEHHPEDLPELLAYWNFLRWRRAHTVA